MNPLAHKEANARSLAVRQSLASCTLCPRACGVNRLMGELGTCGLDDTVRMFRELLHPAEEHSLSPSHQVYFSGCNLRCEFCSVIEWVTDPTAAPPLEWETLLPAIEKRRVQGAVTLNLLGGEPAVSLHGVLELLARIPVSTRVVWNSNMYYRPCVAEWLGGLIDVFVADLKCGSSACAQRLLDASDYVTVVRQNIKHAAQEAEVIIRCPVLPGHMECCLRPNLEWIAAQLPEVGVSLRVDYIPPIRARSAPMTYLTTEERANAECLLERLGLRAVV